MGIYVDPQYEKITGDPRFDKVEWFLRNGRVIKLQPIEGMSNFDILCEMRDILSVTDQYLIALYNGGAWIGAAVIMKNDDIATWYDDPRLLLWCTLTREQVEANVDDAFKDYFAKKEDGK